MLKYLFGVAALLSVPFMAFASVNISLVGGSVTIPSGQSYSEPGYSAFSSFDGDITNLVSVSGIGSTLGDHTIFYSVTDSNLDSASASRTLTVTGGGEMPYCSGPNAPGWQTGAPGGGCGGSDTVVPAGSAGCPFWFVGGCMVKKN